MANKTKLQKKQEEIKHLDSATQAVITRINQNDRRLRISGFFAICVLLLVGITGIFYQNHLASQNKKHIDCIIKDLATPPPKNTPPDARKYIANLETDCQIKFTK